MTHEEAKQLLTAIGRRVEATFPAWPGERIHAAAQALAASGAYEVVFDGLRSTGQAEAMRVARQACPEFVEAFARSSLAPSADGYERADARIRAITGKSLAEALSDDGATGEFMGVDLSNLPKGAA